MPTVLTIKQICSAYDVSRSSVYNWRSQHRFTVYKVGEKLWVDVPEFEAFIKSNKEISESQLQEQAYQIKRKQA